MPSARTAPGARPSGRHTRTCDVNDFHDGVVHAVEGGEQVEVARDEHEEVQLLRLERNACVGGDEAADGGRGPWQTAAATCAQIRKK